MSERRVTDLSVGETAIIAAFADPQIERKLLAMGALPDSHITLVRHAPFGGAVYLKLPRTYIALRLDEAASIVIRKTENAKDHAE